MPLVCLVELMYIGLNVRVFSGSGAEVDHAAVGLPVVCGLRLCVHRQGRQWGRGCSDRQQPD